MGIKKSYLVQQQTQGKMLWEYFSGTPAETLSRRYGYSETKIKLSRLKISSVKQIVLPDELPETTVCP